MPSYLARELDLWSNAQGTEQSNDARFRFGDARRANTISSDGGLVGLANTCLVPICGLDWHIFAIH